MPEVEEDRPGWGGFIAGMVLGAFAGLAAALLATPRPGRELREEIVNRARELPERIGGGGGESGRQEPDTEGSPLGTIAGSDAASLGLTPPAGLQPPAAEVDTTPERPAPAAFDQDTALRESKPWGTSLAYQSPQAGEDAVIEEQEEAGHVGRAQGEQVGPDQT